MAYLSGCVPCPLALARDSGVISTSIRWKGEESADKKDAEPSECRRAEALQGSAMATCPRGSGKRRSALRWLCLVLVSCSIFDIKWYVFLLFYYRRAFFRWILLFSAVSGSFRCCCGCDGIREVPFFSLI